MTETADFFKKFWTMNECCSIALKSRTFFLYHKEYLRKTENGVFVDAEFVKKIVERDLINAREERTRLKSKIRVINKIKF
jgi:hypothetical protein